MCKKKEEERPRDEDKIAREGVQAKYFDSKVSGDLVCKKSSKREGKKEEEIGINCKQMDAKSRKLQN